jgi:uncharacterized protein YxeA
MKKAVTIILLFLLLTGCNTVFNKNKNQPVIIKEGNTYVPIITDQPQGVVLLPIHEKVENMFTKNRTDAKPIFVPAQDGKQPSVAVVKEAVAKQDKDANIVTVEPIPQQISKVEPVVSNETPVWKKILGTIFNVIIIGGIIFFLYKKRDWFGFDKKAKQ